MRYLIVILFTGFVINQAFGQDNFASQISNIDNNSRHEKYYSERFYAFDEPCETIWYYDDSRLIKIHKGCGDVSMHMFSVDYFFLDTVIVERIIDIYYNAPPTFTEEIAKKEGVTGGWFDPSKTVTDTLIHYLKEEQLTETTKNDSIINYSLSEAQAIANRIKNDIEFLRSKQCRYIYDKETRKEIYTNADNKLDLQAFHKKLMQSYSYPSNQLEIQTRFVIELIIETDGRISNLKINSKKKHMTPAEQALSDLINTMTDLNIAECNGHKVPMKYKLPLMIDLE